MSEESNVVAKGVLTIITDKLRARNLLQSSLEGLGYRVVPFDDVRSAAAYVEADIHLFDSEAAGNLRADLHRLEESAPVLVLLPPGRHVTPAVRQASAGFIGMAARVQEYALRLEIAAASSAGAGYRTAAPRNGSHSPGRGVESAAHAPKGAVHILPAPSAPVGPTPPAERPQADRDERPATESRVALVADGDGDARHLAMFKLRALGFDPVEAASGSEALQLATRQRLDLVIVSDDLPPDGGLELLERLRADRGHPGSAAIVTTAAPTSPAGARAETDGAAVLVKPFRVNELAECVGRVTPAPSQRR